MNMNIFLDLEETVIKQWSHSPDFMAHQCAEIRNFLTPLKAMPFKLFIFSMAIHSDEDKDDFDMSIMEDLKRMIGHDTIDGVVTVPMMQDASEKVNKVRFFDVCDFIQVRGKESSFHDWCHLNHGGEFSVLIDDIVSNRTTTDNDTGTIVQTINVRNISRSKVDDRSVAF